MILSHCVGRVLRVFHVCFCWVVAWASQGREPSRSAHGRLYTGQCWAGTEPALRECPRVTARAWRTWASGDARMTGPTSGARTFWPQSEVVPFTLNCFYS